MTANTSFRPGNSRFALIIVLALASTGLMAQSLSLQPAQAGDLVATATIAGPRSVQANDSRDAVEYFQTLEPGSVLGTSHRPAGESRDYWQRLDGSRLRDGYALALTAPGAVVMVSPGTRATPLLREQIHIVHGGQVLSAEQATDTLVNADDLRATGMSPTAGSVGFRLRSGLENDATLRIAEANGDYVLHVFEPRSPYALNLGLGTDIVHAGGAIDGQFSVSGGARIDAATALLVAPDGSHHDLAVSSTRQGSHIRARAPAAISAQPGLWEVRSGIAAGHRDRAFQRDIRLAFAVVAPTARLDGNVNSFNRRGDGALMLNFGVEVASAGRYELRGVLYGHDGSGQSVPIGVAHYANWLNPGAGKLELAFPLDATAKFSPPFELRDLRLSDQSAVAVIERREHALVID